MSIARGGWRFFEPFRIESIHPNLHPHALRHEGALMHAALTLELVYFVIAALDSAGCIRLD
jgi:hypothetical protein